MDLYVFNLISQLAGRCVFLDKLAIFFAEYFQYIVILCLLLFLVANYKKYLKMFILAVVSAIFARFFIVEIIRYLLPRTRPFVELGTNPLIYQNPAESAFPSGHATFFFALATVVYLYNKKTGILFYIFAFLISISRVFVGIHWPSDILAGAVVGVLSGWLIDKIFKFISKKKAQPTLSSETE